LQQHRAQAEYYYLKGQLTQAVEQLQYAQKETDGNFFEQSVVDARLRELRAMQAEEARLKRDGG
jgi:predicted Zn-dependent protease